MNQEYQEDIKDFFSHQKSTNYSNIPTNKQDIFSISSPMFNYPSKKPCQLDCTHHLHPHLNHHLPHPKKNQEETPNIQKPNNISDITQRKSEICLSEHNCALPCLKHSNELYFKQTNTQNDNIVSQNMLENCINCCQIHFDTNKKEQKNILNFNNFSEFKLPHSPLHPSLNKINNIKHSCRRSTVDLEKSNKFCMHSTLDLDKSNKLCRNILIQGDTNVIDSSSYCDMFHFLDKFSIVLSHLLRKREFDMILKNVY